MRKNIKCHAMLITSRLPKHEDFSPCDDLAILYNAHRLKIMTYSFKKVVYYPELFPRTLQLCQCIRWVGASRWCETVGDQLCTHHIDCQSTCLLSPNVIAQFEQCSCLKEIRNTSLAIWQRCTNLDVSKRSQN